MGKIINKRLPKEQRVGQVGVNNQGEKMTIIVYRNCKNIDIQFENGTIVVNRNYTCFVEGSIKNPNTKDYRIVDKTGEIKCNNQGEKMTIIAYRKSDDIDIQFEDNVIVTNKSYYDFKRGMIKHPLKKEDSLAYNFPNIARMIAISENNLTFNDCFNISCYSGKKFYFKCLYCGIVSNKKIRLSELVIRKGYCKYCSDGLSIPEKFMSNILKQLNIDFQTQLNKSTFNWCKNYRYDFYILSLNMIIETHGGQHYEEGNQFKKTLEEEQANDRYKKHLAKLNRIKRYYQVDCRKSELEYIKNNIIKSLGHLFDLSKVDWELAYIKSQKSKCIEAWELWNSGIHSTTKIGKILDLNCVTISTYLKKGKELGKCNYTYEIAQKEKGRMNSSKNCSSSKKIICITTKQLFYCMNDASVYYNCNTSGISMCCKGKRKSCGKLEDGTPLVWRYININHNKILKGNDIVKLHSKINEKVA